MPQKGLIWTKSTSRLTRQYSSCICVSDVYILAGQRTPIGCFQGQFASLNAIQLGTKALTGTIERAGINKDDIQEIVIGCHFLTGLGVGPGHQIAMFSGLSNSVISSSVSKACASGIKAIMFGCQLIKSNAQELVAVGGIESVTNVPFILKRKKLRLGNLCVPDLIYHDGLIDSLELVNVTTFAEETVKEFKYTRADQDDYALGSYSKAAAAQQDNVFAAEIEPIVLKKNKDAEEIFCHDEEVSRVNLEKFRELPPETGKDGTITVGNSSGLHDGAAMLLLANGSYVLKKNLTPLAKIVSYADSNTEPRKFVLAPSIAIPKALVLANLCASDIHRWEISETFAVSALANTKILQLDPSKVNVYGGAISLGHPFGMTGARLVVHLAHTLCKGELGCASISHVMGGASAIIIQKM